MIELIAVRHGESEANVAFPRAAAAGSEETGLTGPDSTVDLTDHGRAQATAVGRWLASRPAPDAVLTSPYRRARETTRLALTGTSTVDVRVDERLRDREWGALEMLTLAAVRRRFPEELRRWQFLGDFRYRPPGGESMADVALRIRSLLADLTLRHAGQRVLVVGHDSTVAMLRLAIEDRSEEDPVDPIRNASVTRWVAAGGRLTLAEFNGVAHLGG
jgi:broad specificity phosphatase PhoE